jgi:hypothetical protein
VWIQKTVAEKYDPIFLQDHSLRVSKPEPGLPDGLFSNQKFQFG